MPYDFQKISNRDLTLFFIVINDLEHKATLMTAGGPLPFNNTPKGITLKDDRHSLTSSRRE